MPTKDPEKRKAIQARADAKRTGRSRNFATVVYPESAPPDWIERLDRHHVAALISPLHDKDRNPNGEPKKPHYHVLLMFDSPTNYESKVAPIFAEIGGVGREMVSSTRGYARYLCHLDNPEKAQYSSEGIVELGGADYADLTRRATDAVKAVREMIQYIRENNVLFYSDFVDYCAEERPDWFESLVTRNTYPVYTYIKARSKKADICSRVGIDLQTGEIYPVK